MKTIHELPLMPKDWLQRRMARYVIRGQRGAPFRPTVTLYDIARWFDVDYSLILHMEDESLAITDKWQLQLSQFFYLLDMGLIELKVKGRRKTWARATPKEPPCKTPMPRIDFATTKLKFD